MYSFTSQLVLDQNAAVDLQLHTTYSDGTWVPDQLLNYLKGENFSLAAITDHDRVDTVVTLQNLAIQKQMPLIIATEMTTSWRDAVTDILCYGFDPKKTALNELAQDVQRRQQENTTEVFQNLCLKGYIDTDTQDIAKSESLLKILAKPNAQQPHDLFALLKQHSDKIPEATLLKAMEEAGFSLATNNIMAVVDAAHRDGAVCLVAHPGRSDGFMTYDGDLLDQLRQEVPIDGLEAYYPAHTAQQIDIYLEYARKHQLLISAGSDSHGPQKEPIKYSAHLSRTLLERLGIQIKE